MAKSLMDHERHRWSYMTRDQLKRRLRKITKQEKLECFLIMARNQQDKYLEEMALLRMVQLQPYISFSLNKPKPGLQQRLGRAKRKPVKQRRAVSDFEQYKKPFEEKLERQIDF